jgi:hypothetical protein
MAWESEPMAPSQGHTYIYAATMPTQPPATPRAIVIAKPPAAPVRTVQAAVASPSPAQVRIVFAPRQKQRDAWRRFLALTGRDDC